MSLSPIALSLRDLYTEESARIEREFQAQSDGLKAIQERAALVDKLLIELSRDLLAPDPNNIEKLCVVALGGYGRRELFPYSDIDLLFLWEDSGAEKRYQKATREISRTLWDLHLRASPTSRTLAECEKLHRDNAEFNISVLDARYLTGDARLFARLHNDALPRLIIHERAALLGDISELTQERHQKEGNTIFHLEPNLKNSPGGLRDFHVACWVALLSQRELLPNWGAPQSFWPAKMREEMESAFAFLAAARCFLHYRQGRDGNVLSYELQAEAASHGIGVATGGPVEPADWMRIYFRHARTVYSIATQLLDEALPARASLRGRLENWRARWLHPDFSVVGDHIRIQQQAVVRNPERLLGLFEFIAREGVKLSREAEEQIREALPTTLDSQGGVSNLWEHLRKILVGPHAAVALRAMHSTGLLVRLFPEFGVIDSLVIRDFYHHYTVDAHTLIAIENIHRLRKPQYGWERPFADIFSELEEPELLFLSLLFHDAGKGMPCEDHVVGSLQAIERVFPRLDLRPEEADTVRFLIRDHLAMSANLMRRDIFDLQTIRAFAEAVSTPERLKLLCLFTYADIRAVNPEALTPWKAESLWQLYVSTANYMSRSLDAERFHVEAHDVQFVERILPLLPEGTPRERLATFLEGLPRRYVLAHSPEEMATHFQMAQELDKIPVQLRLEKRSQMYLLTLLAIDRPFLFAGISGTLASWGMNIWKAEAFANAAGIVMDTFHFTDPHNTLVLNPSEGKRLENNIADVLLGVIRPDTLMRGRTVQSSRPPKVSVPTEIRFDDSCSTHSTLMEIITQDEPGLLYRLSAALANNGCNIEVALIDTEGQRAVDAFYLTFNGDKLGVSSQQALRTALLAQS
jgi:[protein-PII] uridylyltransferase